MSVFRWMKTDWHHFAHKTLELLTINTIHIMNDAWQNELTLPCTSVHQHEPFLPYRNQRISKSISIFIRVRHHLPSLDRILATQIAVTFIYRLSENSQMVSHSLLVDTHSPKKNPLWFSASFGQHSVDRIIDFVQRIFMIQFLAA